MNYRVYFHLTEKRTIKKLSSLPKMQSEKAGDQSSSAAEKSNMAFEGSSSSHGSVRPKSVFTAGKVSFRRLHAYSYGKSPCVSD